LWDNKHKTLPGKPNSGLFPRCKKGNALWIASLIPFHGAIPMTRPAIITRLIFLTAIKVSFFLSSSRAKLPMNKSEQPGITGDN
jgi:hypothetical protein